MSKSSRSAPFEEKSAALREFENDLFDARMRRDNMNKVYKRWAKSYDKVLTSLVEMQRSLIIFMTLIITLSSF